MMIKKRTVKNSEFLFELRTELESESEMCRIEF